VVDHAADPAQALSLIREHRPAVLVAERGEVRRLLAASDRDADAATLPVVALIDASEQAPERGVCGARPGSCSPPDLLLAILQVLDCHGVHAPLRASQPSWVCPRHALS